MLLAAAIGAAFGAIIVTAVSLSLRLLGRRRAEGPDGAASRPLRLPLPVQATIILLTMIGYGWIGYVNRTTPAVQTTSAPQQEAATSDATPSSAPVQLDIGGVALSFQPPPGYCFYPAPLLQSVIDHQAKINPDNVVHTVFGNCDQLRSAYASQTRIRDFGMLMTPKAELTTSMDQSALDRIVAKSVDPSTLKQTLDQRLKQAQSRLQLQTFSSLGILEHDPATTYFAYLFKANTQDEKFAQACIMAMTTMKGRLVTYYLYSDYDRDARSALLGLLQRVRAGLDGFTAQNS